MAEVGLSRAIISLSKWGLALETLEHMFSILAGGFEGQIWLELEAKYGWI